MKAPSPRTVLDYLRLAEPYLARQGIPSARLDAEVLLACVLGVSRLELYTRFDQPLVKAEVDAYREALVRRARREPVAYITGVKEFYGLSLRVGPGVLVPRPETEFLVEQVLGLLGRGPGLVVDVGTGCGAIALAVAHRHPEVPVLGVDSSPAALEYARANGERTGAGRRVRWLLGDALEALADASAAVVVSNPPYVPTGELMRLAPEIARYEPKQALDGGADGLEVARRIVAGAPRVLLPGGTLLMELGSRRQAERLAEWARRNPCGQALELHPPAVDAVSGAVAFVARRMAA